ncbi:MAG: tetratricopeptide repeat protein [Dehalococcoidia bacterium]
MKRLKRFFAAAHLSRGRRLAMKGLLDEAIEEYREALHLEPGLAEAHCLLGAALHCKTLIDGTKNPIDDAISECRAALMLNPEIAEAHCTMGRALFDKGLVEEAIKEHREALRLKTDFPEAHYELGLFLIHKGRIDEGLVEIREAIRLEPNLVRAHYKNGFYTTHTDLINEATKKIEQASAQGFCSSSTKPNEDFSMHLLALNPYDGSGPYGAYVVREEDSMVLKLVAVTTDGRISHLTVGRCSGELKAGRTLECKAYQELQDNARRKVLQLPKDRVAYVCVAAAFRDVSSKESVLIQDVVGVSKDMQERLNDIYGSLLNSVAVGDSNYERAERFLQSEPIKSWINEFLKDLKQKLNWSGYVKQCLDNLEEKA